MVGSRILLFLAGTAIASSHVLRNGMPGDTGVIIGGRITPEDATSLQPMVSLSPSPPLFAPPPFVQQGTNLYYKPQFVLPAGAVLPSPFTNVIDKNDRHKHKLETPQLPPLAMIELPISKVQHPTFQPIIVEEPPKPIKIPQAPALPYLTMPEPPTFLIPAAPEVHVSEFEPIQIPEAPVLPSFSMPELPVPIAIEIAPEAPKHDEVLLTPTRPTAIPEGPILPPFSMPKIPSVVSPVVNEIEISSAPEFKPFEIPEAPVLPPLSMPELPAVFVPATPESNNAFTNKPLVIPEAPTLPMIPCFPEVPVLPLLVSSPEVIEYQPLPQIPEAPQLPSFTMPEIPTIIVQEPTPIALVQPVEEVPAPHKEIPPAPVLPPFEMPSLPISPIELYEAPKPAVVAIPEAPVLPPFVPSPEVVVCQPMPQIPEAPELPPFTMPEIPTTIVQELTTIAPAQPVEEVPAPIIEIPSAPVLGPFEMPALPVIVETPDPTPVFKPVEIPPAPELPPIPLPIFPEPVIVDVQNEINEEPRDDDEYAPAVSIAPTVYVPEVPFIASAKEGVIQPTFWAQNIIIERFLPSVVINDKEDLARALKEGSSYPVITKPYFIATSH